MSEMKNSALVGSQKYSHGHGHGHGHDLEDEGEDETFVICSEPDVGVMCDEKKENGSILEVPTPLKIQLLFPPLQPTEKRGSEYFPSRDPGLPHLGLSSPAAANASYKLSTKKKRSKDHIWSFDTCYTNGCKECCACAERGFQCDGCAEYNLFDHNTQRIESDLQVWYEIASEESDGFLAEDMEVIDKNEALNDLEAQPVTAEAETFELVDDKIEGG